jgi:glyoxylase-like metal-dependent hydrolase (beta-lactamase superfamily II)
MTTTETRLEPVLDGLYVFAPEPLPFAPSLHVRAFLLRREQGNVLVYGAPLLAADSPEIDALGGISRRYLNHRHEAMFLPETFPAPLFVHEDEQADVERRAHVRATFSTRHTLDDDFEVIPTPGHTSGATAYRWTNGEHRFLFTGDTVYLSGGEWRTALLDSSDRDAYLDSLRLIRELDFDVLVPWGAGAGEPFYALTNRADTARRIDAALDELT